MLPDPRESIMAEVAQEDKNSAFGDYGESSGSGDSEAENSDLAT